MMGRQTGDQSQLFYLFNLERRIPAGHLLRRINPVVTRLLADLHERLASFYSEIGRPSIDPELMIRMLIVSYCYGIRFERKLCEEVELHLAYRWFCRLDLDDKVPDHSTFSVNRHGRFRDSDILRDVFEAVVRACMDAGLVKGEGFAVDASVIEADASRYHGNAPDEIDWSAPERQTRAVAESLSSLDDEDAETDRKLPKVISPTDPCSAWTAKANKREASLARATSSTSRQSCRTSRPSQIKSGGRRRTYRTRISHDPLAQGLSPESTVAPRREAVNTAIGKSAN